MSYCDWSLTVSGNRHKFGEVQVVTWNIGGREYRTDDTDRPRTDGRWFGQDFANPGDVEIDLIIRAKGPTRQERFEKAMALRTEFNRVWDADEIRLTPGALTELEIAGVAIVEGRPRHVDWDDSLATFGIIRGKALFVRDRDQAYEAGEMTQSVTVGIVALQQGGLVAPLIAPLTTARSSSRAASFEVEGTSEAWPIITVSGPLQSGAKVELAGKWELHLSQSLAYDQVAVFDTRPGKRTMKLNGKAMNLLLPSGARLSQMTLPVGMNSVALRGKSVEGTATVRLQWRNVKKVI